jgi:hypothetical protein
MPVGRKCAIAGDANGYTGDKRANEKHQRIAF